jgi:hypothetical protein
MGGISGVLDPDLDWIRIQLSQWIRIGNRMDLDPLGPNLFPPNRKKLRNLIFKELSVELEASP